MSTGIRTRWVLPGTGQSKVPTGFAQAISPNSSGIAAAGDHSGSDAAAIDPEQHRRVDPRQVLFSLLQQFCYGRLVSQPVESFGE